MALSTHDCKKNQCTGPKYCGLNIACHNCQSSVFIECIDKVNEIECLLQFLDITAHDCVSSEQSYLDRNKSKLKKIFNGTMIKYVCSNCSVNGMNAESNVTNNEDSNENKITELSTKIALLTSSIESKKKNIESAFEIQKEKLNEFGRNLETDFQSIVASLDEVLCVSAPVFNNPMVNMKSRGRKNKNAQPSANVNQNDCDNASNNIGSKKGIFEVYIAKFERKVTCQQIAQHILKSTSVIDEKLFHVQMLGGSRSQHTFASFKVTTFDNAVCNQILNMNWNPQKARMFTASAEKQGSTNHNPNENSNSRERNTNKNRRQDRYPNERSNNRRMQEDNRRNREPIYQNQNHQRMGNRYDRPSNFSQNHDEHRNFNARPFNRINRQQFDKNRPRQYGNWNPKFNSNMQHPDENDFLVMKDQYGRPIRLYRMDRSNYRFK